MTEDKDQLMHSKDTNVGANWREYELEINGVSVVAKSKDGMMTAWDVLSIADKAKALITVLDAKKTVLADDDRVYEGDDEVNLEDARIFIAVSKYEGTDSVLERIQRLLPGDSMPGRRRL
ncbi:MAG: hypothetical protein OXC12_04640 [Spirochaetaceae bacterium]|nr:hypothetical protein [Spirochaetaceae bacterium]